MLSGVHSWCYIIIAILLNQPPASPSWCQYERSCDNFFNGTVVYIRTHSAVSTDILHKYSVYSPDCVYTHLLALACKRTKPIIYVLTINLLWLSRSRSLGGRHWAAPCRWGCGSSDHWPWPPPTIAGLGLLLVAYHICSSIERFVAIGCSFFAARHLFAVHVCFCIAIGFGFIIANHARSSLMCFVTAYGSILHECFIVAYHVGSSNL